MKPTTQQSHRIPRIILVWIFIVGILVASPAQPAHAATLTVTSSSDSGAGSLRQAVLDATSGDTIDFDPSLSGATITLSTTITLNKNLTIDGSDLIAHIQISGGNSVRVFTVSSGVTVIIDHLDITNGSASSGGGIYSDGLLTVNNSNFDNNAAAGSGGAVFSNSGGLTVSFSTFANNSSGSLGGAIQNYGIATITNSTFAGNTAMNDGGGVYTGVDSLTIENSTFAGNSAGRWGGGIYNSTLTTLNLTNTLIADSSSGGDCHNDGTIGTNTNNLIEDGSCSPDFSGDPQLGTLEFNGGGTRTISLGSSSTAIDSGDDPTCESTDQRGVVRPQGGHCDIGAYEGPMQDLVNSLNDPGDGNCNASECTLREAVAAVSSGTTVTFDAPLAGGTITLSSEIYIDKSLTLDGGSLSVPIKVSGGGSVRVFHANSASRVYIQNLEIIDGDAFEGGGVYNTGLLTITESTFSGNSATYGGGIHNQGSLTVRRSTFYSNSAPTGSAIDSDGVLQVENSTMIDSINNTGGAWVSNSTISSIANDGSLDMQNSLLSVCVNTGLILLNSHNLVENGACNPYKSGNAFLQGLADNGGPTQTRAIPGYSPAVNSGDDATCESTDQRGVVRPQWLHCDIGAYEYEPTLALTVNSSAEPGDGTCDETECTLREALYTIDVGGVITFDPGLAGDIITIDWPNLSLGGDVTIDGSGLNPQIQLSGGNTNGVFHISNSAATVILRHLDFVDTGDNISAVNNEGTLTVDGCNFSNSVSTAGGGIENDGGTLDVRNSTFTNNSANRGGAISNYLGVATITNSTFDGNHAVIEGGGVYNFNGVMTVSNSTFAGNDAASGGGIFFELPGELHLKNTIIGSSASGGDCFSYSGLTTNISNLIEDNSCSPAYSGDPLLGDLADNGGSTQTMALQTGSPAIDAGDDGTCESTDQRGAGRPSGVRCDIGAFEYPSLLEVNSAADPGDGICDASECTLREAVTIAASGDTITFDDTIEGQTINLGAEIEIDKDLTIDASGFNDWVSLSGGDSVRAFLITGASTVVLEHLRFVDGYADTGGAIWNDFGSNLTVTDCVLEGNSAVTGGAINNSGSTLTVNECTFFDNSADEYGGAINIQQGTAMINRSTFEENRSDQHGGAIFSNDSALTVTNSTFYLNDALQYSGGIANYLGTLTLSNSTLSDNYAPLGGGGIASGPSGSMLHMTNTIIANSSSGGDCVNDGTLGTNTNNLIEDGSCSPSLSGDPNLGSLANNGGPTETMALLAGSDAIDGGDDGTCESSDQRRAGRPSGVRCDIGAFEYPSLLEVNSAADPGDGVCDVSECTLREAVTIAASGDTVTFDPALAGSTITLGSEIGLGKDLTVDGSGLTPHVVVSGGDSVRVFIVSGGSAVAISDLDMVDGFSIAGSGIANEPGSTLTLSNCSFDGHNAETGGAINNNNADLTISDCSFTNNHALDFGGAINNYQGEITVERSTFASNASDNNSGAIFTTEGTLTLVNSTLYGNSAPYGGGVINYLGTLTLSNSTLYGNNASIESGGIGNAPGSTLHLLSSIIAGSPSGGDCVNTGTIATNTHTLIEDGGCSPDYSGDPILGPLADNGGSTETMALLSGSPAIDAGDDGTCESTDQRGVSRPKGMHCDIGAFELEFPYSLYLPLIMR